MSIKLKLLLTLIPAIIIIVLIQIKLSYIDFEEILLRHIKREVRFQFESFAYDFIGFTEVSSKTADGMVAAIATAPKLDKESIKSLISENLNKNQDLFGSAAAFVPDKTNLGKFCPYYCRKTIKDSNLRFDSLEKTEYNYTNWDWYKIPLKTGKSTWIEPYFDKGGGNTLMTTYAAPINRNGKFCGVVTVDVSIADLLKVARFLRPGYTGYIFMITKGGHIIAHPSNPLISEKSLWDNETVSNNQNFKKLVSFLKNDNSYSTDKYAIMTDSAKLIDPYTNKLCWFTKIKLEPMEWILVNVFPMDEMTITLRYLKFILKVISIVIPALITILVLWISSTITTPILSFVKQTEKYASGDFSRKLDENKGSLEIKKLSRSFNKMGKAIDDKIQELKDTQKEIVFRLGKAAEYRDSDTGLHIKRMSHYCACIGRAAGLPEEDCNLLLHASSMHDIGKIGIPDSILMKPGKLDTDEFKTMKTHSSIGECILSGSNSRLIEMAQKIAHTHHEKWDGSGYPKGLKGQEVSIEGRIVSICDVFDALTSDRPYKKAWTIEEAMNEIEKKSGIDFDPGLVVIFRQNLSEIISIREKFSE